MNQKPIAPGAIGVWLDCADDGRLWRIERGPTSPRNDPYRALVAIRPLDGGDTESADVQRFWCLLDAGVLEL